MLRTLSYAIFVGERRNLLVVCSGGTKLRRCARQYQQPMTTMRRTFSDCELCLPVPSVRCVPWTPLGLGFRYSIQLAPDLLHTFPCLRWVRCAFTFARMIFERFGETSWVFCQSRWHRKLVGSSAEQFANHSSKGDALQELHSWLRKGRYVFRVVTKGIVSVVNAQVIGFVYKLHGVCRVSFCGE